jgi:hypothetical protein
MKKAQEAGKPVGPIEIYCNDILFVCWKMSAGGQIRKAAHPFEGEN